VFIGMDESSGEEESETTDVVDEEAYGEAFSGFAQDLEAHFTDMMKQGSRAPQDAYEHMQAFTAAIDWSERWIQGILTFHCVLFLVAMVWRKNIDVQMVILGIIVLLVFGSERLNTMGNAHWRSFATQNYFDEHGTFAGAVFCAPLLLIAFCQLISLLILASSALITAKRLELKRKKEAEPESKKTK